MTRTEKILWSTPYYIGLVIWVSLGLWAFYLLTWGMISHFWDQFKILPVELIITISLLWTVVLAGWGLLGVLTYVLLGFIHPCNIRKLGR